MNEEARATFKEWDRQLRIKIHGEQGFTCPDIDKMKNMLEVLRHQNWKLRETANFWKQKCLEILKNQCPECIKNIQEKQ